MMIVLEGCGDVNMIDDDGVLEGCGDVDMMMMVC